MKFKQEKIVADCLFHKCNMDKKILDFPGKKIAMLEKFNNVWKCFNKLSWQPYRGKSSEKQDTVPVN
jgi:hypothetical protein